MAIIDTLRLRNALVRGGIAQDDPACELVDIVDDEFSKLATNFVTRESHEASEHRVLAAIADLGRRVAERDAARAREAEQRAREAAERDAARAREAEQRAREAAERDAARAREAEQRAREAAERDAARAREDERRAHEAAERDRQIHTHITIGIGLIIGSITIATAIISIVIVVLD